MKRRHIFAVVTLAAALFLCAVTALGQWGGITTFWQMGAGGWRINCPPNSCSITGDTVNLPGLSAKSQLIADSTGSATNTLINSGINFPIAANEVGTLNCEIFYTSSNASGGLDLGLNGPGSPTEVTIAAQIQTNTTAVSIVTSQGTSWQTQIGTAADALTSGIQLAELSGGVENGSTAGTLNVQFSDINTSGSVVVKRDSWCSFP